MRTEERKDGLRETSIMVAAAFLILLFVSSGERLRAQTGDVQHLPGTTVTVTAFPSGQGAKIKGLIGCT